MTKPNRPEQPISLLCGYHPGDGRFHKELSRHLASLTQDGRATLQDSERVPSGAVRRTFLEKWLADANVILLLVSHHLTSDRDWSALLKVATAAEDSGRARLVPISVRHVDLENTALAGRALLPRSRPSPLDVWRNRDAGWKEIACEIRGIVDGIRENAGRVSSDGPVSAAAEKAPHENVEARKDDTRHVEHVGRGSEELRKLELELQELEALPPRDAKHASSKKARAVIHDRIARCHYAQGRFIAARADFDRAFDIRRELARAHRDDADAQFDLSTSRFWRGHLSYLEGDLESARNEQAAGLEVCRNLLDRDAANLKAARSLVVLQTDLGTTTWELGDPDGAERHLKASLLLVRKLCKKSSDDPQLRRDLSVGLFRLADLLAATGKTEEAHRRCEESVEKCWELTALDPDRVQWRRHLATARISMGDVRLARNDLVHARGDYEFAVGTMGALAALESEDLQGMRHHARSEKKLGDLLFRADELGAAMAAYARAASAMETACRGEAGARFWRELRAIYDAQLRALLRGEGVPPGRLSG